MDLDKRKRCIEHATECYLRMTRWRSLLRKRSSINSSVAACLRPAASVPDSFGLGSWLLLSAPLSLYSSGCSVRNDFAFRRNQFKGKRIKVTKRWQYKTIIRSENNHSSTLSTSADKVCTCKCGTSLAIAWAVISFFPIHNSVIISSAINLYIGACWKSGITHTRLRHQRYMWFGQNAYSNERESLSLSRLTYTYTYTRIYRVERRKRPRRI